MDRVWLAEKPDQGRRLAEVLGGNSADRKAAFIETPNGIVTWAIGHLLELAEFAAYDPALGNWTLDPLPFVPTAFKRVPRSDGYALAQFKAIGPLVAKAAEVIIATDADREGELIARELLEHFRYRGAVKRLWLTALDAASIRKAVANIRPGSQTEGLAHAASARSAADWLIGLNATRIVSLRARTPGVRSGVVSVGRVQTPTLALVVRRDREIEGFRPSNFFELSANVVTRVGTLRMQCAPAERITSPDIARRLANATQNAEKPIRLTVKQATTRVPKPYSLSTLQAAADKELGWAATKTLQVAQGLYEHALLTYPRTDCEYLPASQTGDVPGILAAMRQEHSLGNGVDRILAQRPILHDWIWNTAKVTAHHAIIPTSSAAGINALDADAQALYALVGRRFLQMLAKDRIDEVSEAELAVPVAGAGEPLVFRARRKHVLDPGWAAFGPAADHEPVDHEDELVEWPPIENGMPGRLAHVDVVTRTTTPPEAYTEGSLISDMRSIGKFVTDPALKAVLKETAGIGTEATRAECLRTLKDRGYLNRTGRKLKSTPLGRALIDDLPAALSDPALTAQWEQQMSAIERAESTLGQFLRETVAFVHTIGGQLKAAPMPHLAAAVQAAAATSGAKGKGGASFKSSGAKSSGAKSSSRPRRAQAATSSNRPTDKMRALVRDMADQRREKVPADVLEDFDACRTWIDQRRPAAVGGAVGGERPPSESQLHYAESLAKKRGWVVSGDVRASAKACSEFINSALK